MPTHEQNRMERILQEREQTNHNIQIVAMDNRRVFCADCPLEGGPLKETLKPRLVIDGRVWHHIGDYARESGLSRKQWIQRELLQPDRVSLDSDVVAFLDKVVANREDGVTRSDIANKLLRIQMTELRGMT